MTASKPLKGAGHERTSLRNMLSQADWEAFWREGFVYLGAVLAADEVDALKRRADALAMQSVGRVGDAPDSYPLTIEGLETDPHFARLARRPLFREICRQMYGAHASVSILRAMVVDHPPGQTTRQPWRQDGGTAWQLDRDPLVTIRVALDPATLGHGCIEVVAGSHRMGLLGSSSHHGGTVSPADEREHCAADRVVALESPAGHAVFMHNWLIHRPGANTSGIARRDFTMCCADARTRGTRTGRHFPVIFGEAQAVAGSIATRPRLTRVQ